MNAGRCASGGALAVVARPAFPYRPIIVRESLWELKGYLDTSSPRKVAGGVYGLLSYADHCRYLELNEYGVIYLRVFHNSLNVAGACPPRYEKKRHPSP